MRRLLFLSALSIGLAAFAATDVRIGCSHLTLSLDSRITPAIVDRDWGSGSPHSEPPAVLELRGCQGQLLNRLVLEGPLARLESSPVRGAPAPTYLVSVDLTAEAGSYNGPLTIPIEVAHNRLRRATARTPEGRTEPIRLALTGKAAWKRDPVGKVDDFLSVSSQPRDGGFVTTYRRYHPTPKGWKVTSRSEEGLWESDGEFPKKSQFPAN